MTKLTSGCINSKGVYIETSKGLNTVNEDHVTIGDGGTIQSSINVQGVCLLYNPLIKR